MSVLTAAAASSSTPVDDVGELGIVASRSAEQQAERGAVALDEAEVGGEPLFDARAPGLHARWSPR